MPTRDGAFPRWWGIWPVILGVTACSLGPSYRRPEVPLPATWSTPPADPQALEPAGDWWKGFGSEQLNHYIAQAQNANDDIGAAMARVLEADAQARIAGAALLPNLTANAQVTHERAPAMGGGGNST